MIDWNLITPFLKIYELNSITKAAQALDVSQPAMSLAIKRLEESLNRQLFIRHGRRIEPTQDAHELASHFSKMAEHYQRALDFDRPLVVYVHESLMMQMPIMEDVHMIESPASQERILEDIRQQKVDMVIDFVNSTESSFTSEHIVSDRIMLACDKNSSIGDKISLEEYLSRTHIVLKLRRNNVYAIEAFSGKSLERKVVRTVTSPSNMLLSIIGTESVCAALESMKPLANKLGLKMIELPFEVDKLNYNMLYHKRMSGSSRHIQLRNTLKSILTQPR